MRRTPLFATAVLAATLFLVACGDDTDHGGGHMDDSNDMGPGDMGHDRDASPVAADARRIEVTASSFAFDPDEITVEAGEDIAIVLSSDDTLHDFTVDDLDAHVAVDAGDTGEGGLRADEPGTYTFYCSVPGHRDEGMEGTLIVE
jgi:plastocyanin